MNIKEIKNLITNMDTKSDEFWDIYCHITDKYHQFSGDDNLDDWQTAVKVINSWMDKSVNNFEEQVVLVAKIVEQVFLMKAKGTGATSATLCYGDETFYFDIYTSETHKDKLNDMLLKSGRAIEKGEFEIKDKRKGFGKKYYGGKNGN